MRAIGVLASDRFEDPANARVILMSAGGLVLIAVLVAAGTFWWWRSSKVEHPALGPLEVMGSRSWWKGDYTSRRRRLEAARPAGAEPVDASVAPAGEPVDLEAAALGSPPQFDDLVDAAVAADDSVVAEAAGASAVANSAVDNSVVASSVVVVGAAGSFDAGAVEQADVVEHDDLVEHGDVDAEFDELVESVAAPSEAIDVDVTSVSAEVPRPIDPLLRLQSE